MMDHELLTRYRDGDLGALEELVCRHRSPLLSVIRGMTRNQDEAEDVFQEVWIRVIEKSRMYKDGNFLGWMIRIARNRILDRNRRRRPELLGDRAREGESWEEHVAASGPDPAAQAVASELGRKIAQAVERLPREQQEVFRLRMQTGLPFKEIAGIQNVSINTALARMQYALDKLQAILGPEYGNPAEGG